MPEKGDVSDWIEAGGTASELRTLVTQVQTAKTLLAQPPKGMTAADLLAMTFPEQRWAVEGLIPEGLSLLGGRPKIGKSWLVLHAAIAVARNGYFLGTYRASAGAVLYMAVEDTLRRLQSRLRQLLRDDTAPANLHLFTEWPRLDRGGLEQLDQWLVDHADARLVIIDTLATIAPPKRSTLVLGHGPKPSGP